MRMKLLHCYYSRYAPHSTPPSGIGGKEILNDSPAESDSKAHWPFWCRLLLVPFAFTSMVIAANLGETARTCLT